MCPNLLMVGPSQGHVLLIHLSYLMIRTCIGKQMDTSVRDTKMMIVIPCNETISTEGVADLYLQ